MALTLDGGKSGFVFGLGRTPTGKMVLTLEGHTDTVTAVSFSPDRKLLVSGSKDRTIKLWEMPSGKFMTCLFDPAALEKGKEVNKYTMKTASGQVITYHLPCGAPIPPGAICACNCVPGTFYIPSPIPRTRQVPSPKPRTPSVPGGTICTCDKICTCVPIK